MKTNFVTVLKNKNFLKIWGAQLISVVTANMINFILLGKIFEATGSAVAIGFLWFFYVFPTILLGPFSGVLLDHFNKKSTLFFSSFLQAFVALFYLGVGSQIWLIYSILLLYSFCDEFFTPTIYVLLPSIVKKEELAAANSISLFTTNGSIILGFLAGGLMLKFLGYSPYLFMAASALLLLSAGLAAAFKWQEPKKKKKTEISIPAFINQLIGGYQFIRGEPKVLFPMMMLTGLQVVIGMGLILLPSIAKTILKIEFADSSYFVLIPVVLGAVLGSLIVERIIGKYLKRVLIINGLFVMGFGLILVGVILPLMPIQVLIGIFLAALLGVAFTLMFIPLQVLVQESTPFRVRGRVFGALNTLITIAAVVPVLGTVTLVDVLGVKLVLALTGLVIIILAIFVRKGKYGVLPANHRA